MKYDKHKFKSFMRNRLVLYFEVHGQILDDQLADFLLEHITNILGFFYTIRDTTILDQRYIKEILFRRFLKNVSIDKENKRKVHRKIIRLRERVFSFLIDHRYLDEKIDTHKGHTRATYEIGKKYLNFKFSLLTDIEKIKECVSSELYDFLLNEGISSYLEFLELQYLQDFSFEELEKRIDEAASQKKFFSGQIQQADPILTSVDLPQELRNKIQGKKISAMNYLYVFEQSEKLYHIAFKIKSNMKFTSELTADKISNKPKEMSLI